MQLQIFKDTINGTELLGSLSYENNIGTFKYDKTYTEKALHNKELGISITLPISIKEYTKKEFDPYFSGLLPEGETYYNLANIYQIPNHEYLYILNKLGCECIGALTFVSEESEKTEYIPHYVSLNNKIINEIKSNPVRAMTLNASNTRLSLSGAQSKTAWYLPHNIKMSNAKITDWKIPYGTAPSTHIIKVFRPGEEDIAQNEIACSRLANKCGLETYEVDQINELPGAIATKRYDRILRDDNTVMRLHQEDFCQALGLPPYMKYQPSSSDVSYLSMIADLLDITSPNPIADKAEMAKRVVFNYLIGNTDAHLKNYSFLYNKEWTSRKLAPMYDLTCIPLTGYSQNMPFKIGDHVHLDEIDEKDIMSIATDLDTSLSVFDNKINEILDGLSKNNNITAYEEKILDNASPRIKIVEKYLLKA